MENYDLSYEILTYDTYNKRLEELVNGNYKNKVTKHEDLGYSSCGFPIEHYSIGNGPMHILYMGGCHSNEIISVDYVTQLMKNMASGNSSLGNIDFNQFTIDFIPLQNPEGFCVTTYALKSAMRNVTPDTMEEYCKGYFDAYRRDDRDVIGINNTIKLFCTKYDISIDNRQFWIDNAGKNITKESLTNYLRGDIPYDEAYQFVDLAWNTNDFLNTLEVITPNKLHHDYFGDVSVDCISEIDDKHKLLKEKIKKMYDEHNYPMGTLCNFFANSDGVNLNDNNENYYNMFKKQMEKYGVVYANLRDNNVLKSEPSPCGCPSYDMSKEFKYAPENEAVLNYVKNNRYYAFFNCHGTGGVLYTMPYENEHPEVRDFNFYINSRIATDYTRRTGNVCEEITGKNDPYKQMGFPDAITGVGDLIRSKYTASILLELSKMGGNPIAPYGDKNGNFYLTMVENFEATKTMLDTVLSLNDLYDMQYSMSYDDNGIVSYNTYYKGR